MDDRLLLAQIDVGITRLEKSMRRAGVVVDGAALKMSRRWEKNNRAMTRSTQVSARAISSALGGLGVGAALTVGTRVIAEFRQSMSTVKAITGATGEEFAALEAKARDLGATTRFSASEAAEGMVALGRAGFDTNEVMASIEGTLLLAQSGALELGQAADIASNVLQGFKLGAEESGRAVDVLALAANSSNTNVEQLGQAMSFVAPASAAVGVSMEETAAAVSALSDAGIQATRAGTGLRSIFIKLGAAGFDFSQQAGGIQGVLKKLAKENIGLGEAAELVGDRQAAALLVLLDSVDKIGGLTTEYQNASGSAKEFAAVMDDNLNGALLATKSRLQEMVISLGEAGGEQALIDLLDKLQDLLVFVAENADTFNKAIIILSATMAGLIGAKALGGATLAIGGFRKALVAANVASGTATLSMRGLTVATRTFLAALGPVGAITIAAGAIAALAVNTKSAKDNFEDYEDTLSDITTANSKVEKDTLLLRDAQEKLAIATRDGGEAAVEAKALEINAINARIAKNKELIKLKRELAKEQLSAGKEEARALEKQKNKITSPSVFAANDTEQANRIRAKNEAELLDIVNKKAANNEPLTKREKKFRELRLEILEHNIAMEEAAQRIKSLDDILNTEAASFASGSSDGDGSDADNGGGSSTSKKIDDDAAKKAEREKEAREKAIEAIREIGKAEIEQIEELQAARITQIEASQKAGEISDTEAAALRVDVNRAAEEEIRDIRQQTAEEDIQSASNVRLAKADEIQLIAEIAASAARVHGRTLEASQIETDAMRARYQAELDDINKVAEARAAAGLEADPELGANRARAKAGIAQADSEAFDAKRRAVGDIQGISDGAQGDDSLKSVLDRIKNAEAQKLAILEQSYANQRELDAVYLAEKAQIEDEFNEARKQARLDDIDNQLNAATSLISSLGAIGKEGSKAQKAAAKVEQGIALGRAAVNTALAISAAAGSAPFPLNIPAIAFATATGAAQVATIASQGFKDGVVDLQGPGTSRSDSIPARLSRGESVLTARATQGNEAALRRLNAGLSPAEAFGIPTPNVAPPNVSVPSLNNISNRSNSISFGDSPITINGNADNAAISRLEAMLASDRKNRAREFNMMANQRDKRLTSRKERKVGV